MESWDGIATKMREIKKNWKGWKGQGLKKTTRQRNCDRPREITINHRNKEVLYKNCRRGIFYIIQIETWSIRSVKRKEVKLGERSDRVGLAVLIISEIKKGSGLRQIPNNHELIYSRKKKGG